MPGIENIGVNVGPFSQQNPFVKIIQTMGEIETIRQERILESRVLGALSRGATAKELMDIVNQPAEFDKGIPGIFQKISAKYAQPSPLKTAITEGAISETLSPNKITMSDIRMREYLKAVAAGDKERADKLLMSSLVTIQTGQELLTPGQRQDLANKDYEKRMGLTSEPLPSTELDRHERIMIKNINAQKRWAPGFNDYPKNKLLQAFRNYKSEIAYDKYPLQQREQLWSKWKNIIANRRNKDWFDEFEFDPTDEDWIKEREVPEKKGGVPAGLESIWGRLTEEEKETARDYISQKIAPEKIVDWFNKHGGDYQFPKQTQ